MDLLKLPKKFCLLPWGEDKCQAGMLVICLVIALSQWRIEIEKSMEGGGVLSMCTYHGPDREVQMPRVH